jgi:nuclease A inhibitor-like protein
MSETDAPLSYYEMAGEAAQHWPPTLASQFLELIEEDQNKLVETIPPDEFFRKLQAGNERSADQIKALRMAIREDLEDVKCYRVGEIRIDIYVLGMANSKVCGLQTLSVET